MKIRLVLIVTVLALVLTLVLVACTGTKDQIAPASGAPAVDGEALVQERCTKCHDLTRVEAAQKTSDEWKTTVTRMVSRGAELEEAEQEAVIAYLAKAYPQ